MDDLARRLPRLLAFGKGMLAVDTAPHDLDARFRALSLCPSDRLHRDYVRMLLHTPELPTTVGTAVLAPRLLEDPEFPQLLRERGIGIGVRADTGCEPMSADGRVRVTSGLDGLAARLASYRALGAAIAVWSVVSRATADRDGLRVLAANGQAAARFALLCQDMAMVPVIRVGTRMGAASRLRREATTAAAVMSVVSHLRDMEVDLAATVLATDPAAAPVLPPRLGGVALTCGWTQLPNRPWPVTFVVGRDVTLPALRTWHGRADRVDAGQQALRTGLARVAGTPRRAATAAPGRSALRLVASTA